MSSYPILSRDRTFASLPQEYPSDALAQITSLLSTSSPRRLVVLDDDPTGTQTCHDISVLTVWDIPTLKTEFLSSSAGFFILTNSRALPPTAAELLIREICTNVAIAAAETGYKDQVDIVLRGDSTLRGHFPLEVDVAQNVFRMPAVDGWVLAPFFFQGGRYTIDDVHYVLEAGDQLVPAGETQFAKDATFGYQSSNLRDYVREKAPGRFADDQIHSVTLKDIRLGGPEGVCERLLGFSSGGVIIANAAAESDMHVFVAGLLLGMYFDPFPVSFLLVYRLELHSRSKSQQALHLPHRRGLRLNPPGNPLHPPNNIHPAEPPATPRNRRIDPRGLVRPQNDRAARTPYENPGP
jgi:hypothetical protein